MTNDEVEARMTMLETNMSALHAAVAENTALTRQLLIAVNDFKGAFATLDRIAYVLRPVLLIVTTVGVAWAGMKAYFRD